MARIIVSYYKVQEVSIGKVLCFWDGFVKELTAAGNDVFLINTAYFNPYNSNAIKNTRLDKALLKKAIDFDPELIITFNHRIPKSFLDYFNVPVIIWDGDELSFFCDHPYIKENINRYTIFSISKGWLQDYKDFGFENDQIFYVPQATAIRKMDIEQSMNVSFLGIRHFHNKRYAALIRTHKYSNRFYSLVQEFLNTGNYDYEFLFKKYFQKDYPELVMELRDLYPLFDYRWLALANMLDLGLTIAGHEARWEDVAEFMPQIAAAYNPKQIWTLEENNWFYNSSKVSMCPVTAQARGAAFSWRVFDIMASNACLLISEASDLKDLTKDYLDMPMYKTPWEARELSIKMLNDEKYRKEIVEASQKYVDENARWIHRFKNLEQIMGIHVVNASGCPGKAYDAILDDQEIQILIANKERPLVVQNGVKESTKYQFLRNKAKKFCYYWSQTGRILDSIKLGILVILLGSCLMLTEPQELLQRIGQIVGWFGMGLLLFAGLQIVIKIVLKYRQLKWTS